MTSLLDIHVHVVIRYGDKVQSFQNQGKITVRFEMCTVETRFRLLFDCLPQHLRYALGLSFRERVSRRSHARWEPDQQRPDPIEILRKTVSYTPLLHPFVERLIAIIHREYPDHTLFWNATDFERKLEDFQQYYNRDRVHQSLDGDTPAIASVEAQMQPANLCNYSWISHFNALFQTHIAASIRNSPTNDQLISAYR